MALQSHEVIWSLATAAVASRTLQVVAELGIADQLGDTPVEASELAARSGVDPQSLDRVLRLLAAHGVFEHNEGRFGHTEASQLLRNDHPMSMRAFPRMMGMPSFLASFDRLDHAIHTGSPAFQLVEANGLFAYLQDHPGEAEVFGESMTAKAAADIAAILATYDFGRFRRIADIGGGRGHLLRAILDAHRSTEGILFDLPTVIDTVTIDGGRLALHAGDFFVDPLPVADVYVLMEVIHDWPDAEATTILSAIRDVAPAGATVLIIEAAARADVDRRVQTLDIIMLAITGGRERTATELSALLNGAGLHVRRILDTPGTLRIVEAVTD